MLFRVSSVSWKTTALRQRAGRKVNGGFVPFTTCWARSSSVQMLNSILWDPSEGGTEDTVTLSYNMSSVGPDRSDKEPATKISPLLLTPIPSMCTLKHIDMDIYYPYLHTSIPPPQSKQTTNSSNNTTKSDLNIKFKSPLLLRCEERYTIPYL